ncbi:hypothetical protein [Roseibacillus persicicus]|uniref:hypothetical protein n=1 Tax=Roseibacillus persicicus TaxID=454148 RepID=UPI00280E254F|nr:hypothetical protein [Roseibacillus persicicus]MDQ8188986.1 hypothetical protein [Roseibacillus persicicus]
MNTSEELIPTSFPSSTPIDLEEAARCCELHPEMIEEFVRGHFVTAHRDEEGQLIFDAGGLLRLRQISILQREGRASLKILRYIVSLIEELELKDEELRKLREQNR